MRKLAYLCVLGALLACKEDERALRSVNAYFSVDSLLEAQAIELAREGARWVKTVTLDGTSETDTLMPDLEGWRAELTLLSEFDLNKPSYVGAYATQQEGEQTRYALKPKEKAPVQWLQVALESGEVTKVSGSYQENKTIYRHTRELNLTLANRRILMMEIKGVQDMIFKDSIHYSLRGYVLK